MIKRMLICIVLLGLVALVACNKQNSAGDGSPAASSGASNAPATAMAEPAPSAAPALPANVILADGKSLPVLAASAVDGNPKAHAGLVAISGEVSQVFADKGAFMLKDCPKDDDCKTADSCGCCSQAQVPVRLALADFDGSLPAVKDDVIVIAELSPTETGYTLAVREVRSGDKTILTRKA